MVRYVRGVGLREYYYYTELCKTFFYYCSSSFKRWCLLIGQNAVVTLWSLYHCCSDRNGTITKWGKWLHNLDKFRKIGVIHAFVRRIFFAIASFVLVSIWNRARNVFLQKVLENHKVILLKPIDSLALLLIS